MSSGPCEKRQPADERAGDEIRILRFEDAVSGAGHRWSLPFRLGLRPRMDAERPGPCVPTQSVGTRILRGNEDIGWAGRWPDDCLKAAPVGSLCSCKPRAPLTFGGHFDYTSRSF